MGEAQSPRPEIELPRGHLLLIGTGAVAVSALPGWITVLRSLYGWQIRACLTPSAASLVASDAVAATSQNPVLGPEWPTAQGQVPHLAAAEWADLILVMPAGADFLGKCAHGICDTLALNIVLNSTAPTVLVPAIPDHARGKPAVQRNLAQLAQDGFHLVPPARSLSVHTGEEMAGGMAGIGTVLRFISSSVPT